MRDVKRLDVLGAPADALTFDRALDAACQLARDHSRTSFVVAVNPEKVMTARADAGVNAFLHAADLVIPDGTGIVAAAKILFGERIERVAGADLMQAICAESGKRGVKIFLYGSKEATSEAADAELRKRYPDILLVGRENGYLPEEKFGELVERINASGADVLFLALGSPKQEKWMNRYADELDVGLCMGIGGTLDTIAGTVRRAPLSWQKARCEWLYRLIRQPSRFWRQRRIFFFAARVLLARAAGTGRRERRENRRARRTTR